MAATLYNEGKKRVLNGGIDLDTSDLRILLVKDTYVVNPDHAAVDDGTADDPASHELTVDGYARVALANKTVTKDDTNNSAFLDADDTAFAALTTGQTIGGIVLYLHTGVDTTSIPLAFYPVSPGRPTSGAAMTVQWPTPANGAVLKA